MAAPGGEAQALGLSLSSELGLCGQGRECVMCSSVGHVFSPTVCGRASVNAPGSLPQWVVGPGA